MTTYAAGGASLPVRDGYASAIEGYEESLLSLQLLSEQRRERRAIEPAAEREHLKRIADAWRAGQIDYDDLALLMEDFKAVGSAPYTLRWNEALPTVADVERVARRHRQMLPNGPHGTWEGEHPFGTGTTPPPGTCVVYVLFDDVGEPCYVGSTEHFRLRLNVHARDGRKFVYWRAHPCADRAAAYALEDRLLKEHKPYLNRRAAA